MSVTSWIEEADDAFRRAVMTAEPSLSVPSIIQFYIVFAVVTTTFFYELCKILYSFDLCFSVVFE
jgi:hypothetical protein